MAVKVGDVVYLWCHAYLRLIGRVEEIIGSRRVSLSSASKILADESGDEAFFRRGISGATKTAYVGNVPDIVYLGAFEFPFPLPTSKKG